MVRLIIGAYGPLFADIITVSAAGPFISCKLCMFLPPYSTAALLCLSWQLVAGVALRMLEPLISFDSVAE